MKTHKMQKKFLEQIGDLSTIMRLIDLLPDVGFFMKDKKGRFMLNNLRACQFCNADNEMQTIGKSDYDFFSKDRADFYVQSDKMVMESGVPILNEIAPAPENSDRLMIHSKFPLYNKQREVIGVVGFHRMVEDLRNTPRWYGKFATAVAHIHKHYKENINFFELAKAVGISQSQFERRFAHILGTTPHEYLVRVRVAAARAMLEQTTETIVNIAYETGFYDHSHFIRSFKRVTNMTPGQYRKHFFPI